MSNQVDIAALRALLEKATPGEWRWNVNLASRSVYLESTGRGHSLEYVMDFARWGMGCAAPRFRSEDDLMVRADELTAVVPGREHHEKWYRTLRHPDADMIVALVNAAPALLAAYEERERLRAEVERLRAKLCGWHHLECPCCGEEGAFATEFYEGGPIACGCTGTRVCADGDTAWIDVDSGSECAKCAALTPPSGGDGAAVAMADGEDPK